MQLLLVALAVGTAYADFRFFNPRYPVDNREQDGPYQPSGWRPSGPPLVLPARQQLPSQEISPPPQSYLPAPTYGPPAQEYGPPETPVTATTTEAQEATTTELPETTTEGVQEAEQLVVSDKDKEQEQDNEVKENEKLSEEKSGVSQQGIYYIYHPSGLLQRVIYMTNNDAANMAYTAQLKYEDVEPIREPIYTYDPKTLVFSKVQV